MVVTTPGWWLAVGDIPLALRTHPGVTGVSLVVLGLLTLATLLLILADAHGQRQAPRSTAARRRRTPRVAPRRLRPIASLRRAWAAAHH